MKTIGIVCEGPRDKEMLESTIMHFMDCEYNFSWFQPNPEFGEELGAGWKGVWRWCENYAEILNEFLTGVVPNVDLLIIQMDADVARCEREIYCTSIDVDCPVQGTEDPLNCSVAKAGNCAQELPPNCRCDGSEKSRIEFLSSVLSDALQFDEQMPVVITIPCDSTDAWILAAFEEDLSEIESIDDPWSIITLKKDYHGIRIPGRKKQKEPYRALINHVCREWETVKAKCPQSQLFENKVRSVLLSE